MESVDEDMSLIRQLLKSIDLHRDQGDYLSMLHDAEQLCSLSEKSEAYVLEHACGLATRADALRHLHRADEALECGRKAQGFSHQHGFRAEEAIALNAVGNALNMLKRDEEALVAFERAVELERSLGRHERAAGVLHNIGIVYRYREPDRALEYYREALACLPETTHTPFKGIILRSIAEYYLSNGDLTTTLTYAYQALEFLESHGYAFQTPIIRNIIGLVYYELTEFSQAQELFEASLAVCRELQQPFALKQALGMLGHIYSEQRRYDDALRCYREVLELTDEKEYTARANIVNGLAGIEYYREDFVRAEAGYREVLNLLEVENQDPGLASIAKHMLARCLLKRSETAEVRSLLESALDGARSVMSKAIELSIRESFDEMWVAEGDFVRAYDNHKEIRRLIEAMRDETARDLLAQKESEIKEFERTKQLELAREREVILNNVLPEQISARLIGGENPIADSFESVSILFMDIVDFTSLANSISAQQLVHVLNGIFSAADGVMRGHKLEKIKTIGDAYMAAAGVPVATPEHARLALSAALDLRDAMQSLVLEVPTRLGEGAAIAEIPEIQVRIGLHCGPAAAGVVGENKFHYDLWGDSVNIASRMESLGDAHKVHVSSEFVDELRRSYPRSDEDFLFIDRGTIEVKGKGSMRTYFVERQP